MQINKYSFMKVIKLILNLLILNNNIKLILNLLILNNKKMNDFWFK